MSDEYAWLLADVVALVDTLEARLRPGQVIRQQQDALFAVLDGLAEVGNLNAEASGTDFGEGHTAGQLYLARGLLVKIKKELV
jgi:hypothetical protein